jgi:hypothetical protein
LGVFSLGGHLANAFWRKDFLPEKIPGACIMTFGYNAAAAFAQLTSDMTDHAKSLLSNLIDKREDSEVHTSQSLRRMMTDLTRSAGERWSSYLRSTLSGRDCGEASEGILGCDDPDLDVSQYFLVANLGAILITIRNPDCKIYATAGWCELGQMGMESASTLMLKTTVVKNLSDTSAREF